ncbi:MAG TPA: hydrogenase maturation protease [Candidatus Eremiobacteraceae bacterium]|nr:hydrogenase maturation protease [Candidatus Eremiobacteraceae bacterium]
MSRALILACGNTLRGDDGVGLYVANSLADELRDPEITIQCDHQWTPELAEPISEAELVIFVDASASLPPGEIACQPLQPAPNPPAQFTHQTSPSALLSLAAELYGHIPARSYLLTVGGKSFDLLEELSEPVRQAVPAVLQRIRELLSRPQRPES